MESAILHTTLPAADSARLTAVSAMQNLHSEIVAFTLDAKRPTGT
jgi:hypothetical protein